MYKDDKPADKRLKSYNLVLTHFVLSYRISDIRYQTQDCIVAIYFRREKYGSGPATLCYYYAVYPGGGGGGVMP